MCNKLSLAFFGADSLTLLCLKECGASSESEQANKHWKLTQTTGSHDNPFIFDSSSDE